MVLVFDKQVNSGFRRETMITDFKVMMRHSALMFILVLLIGCSGIPCYPPEYYAPEEGAPYAAEEVNVSTQAGHVLAGTLTIPKDGNQPLPGVVLITGSSPQNRDFSPPYVSEYRPFRQIADALSRRGIAVLRMDDRGCGCSGGGPLESATTAERADDIRAGISYLKAREGINSSRIGLIGWSEGAIIAPMIAVTDSSIIAIVLMAGTATKGDVIFDFQDGTGWRGYVESMPEWHQFFIEYDPLPTAEMVRCPVLIFHGDKDKHVPVEHANIIAEAIRRGGNQDVTVHIFSDHDHAFIHGGLERLKEEVKKKKKSLNEISHISPDVLGVISDWIVTKLTL
jgi:dipeptidyl aminopeptidase/acylaminoacyl peptidase